MKKIKYRIQYSKTDAARFTSHLDVARAISRTLRRAGLPVAFSLGFNPAPRLSFGPPLPLGLESEAEFFDLELTADLAAEAVFQALKETLPPGLKVIKVQRLIGKTSSLMAGIKALSYQFLLQPHAELGQLQVKSLLEQLWTKSELPVMKRTKSGEQVVNIRPLWLDYRLDFEPEGLVFLTIKVEFGPRGTIRPDDFCTFLAQDFQIRRVIRKAAFFEEKVI
ncbi:MAG: DUF2344 domain-containing protein [Firmicutes bacterium]|nr:DUF2344 domain-containing protein [Bacillota bacterium]